MDVSNVSPLSSGSDRPLVVGIGGSAGAVEALQQFFKHVPEESGLAFVVVMHLAPTETSQLAEVLQACTSMPVKQVTEPTSIEADHVYVAAPGRTLLVEDTRLLPYELQGEEERRAPIDQFFRSLAQADVQPMGVVLSGAGTDGSVGLRAIKEAGGIIAAQDPSEAGHSSMPRSAIETSRVDFVLPVATLAGRLSDQPKVLERVRLHDVSGGDAEEELADEIFEQVHAHTGHDFSEYKKSTMLRRILRRLQVQKISALSEYLTYLREHPSEATALQKDLLISVTSFFRNPDAFEALNETVLEDLLAEKTRNDQVRVWVVGCATGEEAYSIAMMLLAKVESASVTAGQIQIFATDLDEGALATAREGRYPEAIAADVPKEYLERFFERDGTEYIVRSSVRERVLFTPHSLLKDPPFSKLDLISCRNLLIYLRRELQASVFDLFSYALNDGGYLFLGSSESADVADDNFKAVDKSHRLYRRREGSRTVPELPSMPLASTTAEANRPPLPDAYPGPSEALQHRRMLEAYAPPSAIVDEDYTFVHLSQRAGRYLRHPAGTPNANIVELVRPELRVKLRSALREAFSNGRTARTQPVDVRFDGEVRSVRIVVRPGREVAAVGNRALVIFVESEESLPPAEAPDEVTTEEGAADQLEEELEETKKELRATIEEHETSKQEMRAANEELRSMNEEYKSMTEELETSKEELQSVNEELKTVNRELEGKVDELEKTNSDLKNLMAATDIGTLFLDRQLRIQRYTPRIEELFNIRASDIERPIGDLTHQLDYDSLEADAQEVLKDLVPVERECSTEDGEWFLVRHHPYRTVDDRIDGVVITFVDITRRVEAEEEVRTSNEALKQRTEQVEALSDALTSAEERERERIGTLLHDDLQQKMFAARLKVDHLQERGSLNEEQGTLASRAKELLDQGVETARTLSSELNPPVGNQSLRDTLEWLAMHMQESYGLSVSLKMRGTANTADDNLRILLFRMVRELLFNVVKHAGVEEATLRLVEGEDRLRVVVEDRGTGFEMTEDDDSGVGLVSVRDRIKMIGGSFDIETAPGEGTRVAIEVPWRSNGTEEDA